MPGAVAKSYVQTKEPELKSAFDLKSTLTGYRRDDYLLNVFFGVLAGKVSPYKKSPGNKDLEMRKRATKEEAEVVCRFCRWLKRKQAMPAIVDEYSDEAIRIWCTSPSPDARAALR